ncbi:MAG: DNA mismatch repair protein MutS, partial [Kiritimatiellia bacterium]
MSESLTPMMQQYRRIKSKLPPNTILFFRLGDFYEMFFEDAVEASAILNIALTRRQKAPMCGVPYHSHESYLSKLIRAGRKVAICDQVEDPALAKGIVRREVTGVVTPGAVLSDQLLDSARNNFLAGIYRSGGMYGLAFLDLSTGEFWMEETKSAETARDNILRFAPAECVAPTSLLEQEDLPLKSMAMCGSRTILTPCDDWTFEYATASDTLKNHFKVQSLEGFGCENLKAGAGAAGGVLHYVKNTLLNPAGNVRSIRMKNPDDYLFMDEATRSNLDLVVHRGPASEPGTAARGVAFTLLGVLDATRTAMGGRRLREWILRPLTDISAIKERQEIVAAFCADRILLKDLREKLGEVRDLERIMGRLASGSGWARDLRALAHSLAALGEARKILDGADATSIASGCRAGFTPAKAAVTPQADPPIAANASLPPAGRRGTDKANAGKKIFDKLARGINPLPAIRELVESSIVEEPPALLKDGGAIRQGYNPELDGLRDAASRGRAWMAEYQTREQQRTGIKTLKVRFNQVFGYYIEVSKGQAANVPADYTRKQTMVNAERFITPELKEFENKITGAHERAVALESELLAAIRGKVLNEADYVLKTAGAVSALDALGALADRAMAMRYVRPVIKEGDSIRIREGRHPVIEQIPGSDRFVPNDTSLDCSENRLIIITGPNMAGKSTYIRQVALIVIMAQVGSFVPAAGAEIGIVDRIFTRVGASDDLVRGRSTFMVEMQETANILNNATKNSLVILDEIGRGTSTFDGISIAWAVAEFLH